MAADGVVVVVEVIDVGVVEIRRDGGVEAEGEDDVCSPTGPLTRGDMVVGALAFLRPSGSEGRCGVSVECHSG